MGIGLPHPPFLPLKDKKRQIAGWGNRLSLYTIILKITLTIFEMDDKTTLRSLFDSKKNELEQKLEGLSLPKDNQKIQELISSYLSELFDSEGEFRQNLTQSEDYLLQATMSLLTAQQEMGNAFLSHKASFKNVEESTPQSSSGIESTSSSSKKIGDYLSTSVTATQSLAGTGAGAVFGRLVFGGWGAVFGA